MILCFLFCFCVIGLAFNISLGRLVFGIWAAIIGAGAFVICFPDAANYFSKQRAIAAQKADEEKQRQLLPKFGITYNAKKGKVLIEHFGERESVPHASYAKEYYVTYSCDVATKNGTISMWDATSITSGARGAEGSFNIYRRGVINPVVIPTSCRITHVS